MFANLKAVAVAAAFFLTAVTTVSADSWKPIRSGASSSGWQKVVCDRSGNGWRSCNMGLSIVIQATPGSLAALGEKATLVATVQDYDGNNVGSGVVINWTTSDGGLSAASTTTDASGQTAVTLTSSNTLGGGPQLPQRRRRKAERDKSPYRSPISGWPPAPPTRPGRTLEPPIAVPPGVLMPARLQAGRHSRSQQSATKTKSPISKIAR